MSHIPASAMPHAKPHDDHAAPSPTPSMDAAPPAPAAPDDAPPETKKQAGGAARGASIEGVTAPMIAIAAVGALAIAGIVAAVALRRSEARPETAKNKGGRPRKHTKPE